MEEFFISFLNQKVLKKAFFLLLAWISPYLFSIEPWIHLELGSGNYGQQGEDQIHWARFHFDPYVQYKLLFSTLDELISRNGPDGVIVLNDKNRYYLKYAAEKLQNYIEKQGYDQIQIDTIKGNYFVLDFSDLLEKYNRNTFDSIHLKNPETQFYGVVANRPGLGERSRKKTRENLQRIANYSQDGLYLFITDFSIPVEEQKEFIDVGKFYQKTEEWEPVMYIYPSGETEGPGKVFFIPSRIAP